MGKLNTAVSILRHDPWRLIPVLGQHGILNFLPDRAYLTLVYRAEVGKRLNLDKPRDFCEKLQWLKLYDRRPTYIKLVDKYEFRKYIAEKFGPEYLIPLIGIYDTVEEIPWENLPNSFALKCTHGSGCNIICEDKSKLDIGKAIKKLRYWMNRNWYWGGREWPYKYVKPRIVIEAYMSEDNAQNGSLTDYKLYCFNGEPQYCQVIANRRIRETIDFFDTSWNHMEFSGLARCPHAAILPSCPKNFKKMLEIAKSLSESTFFVRIDMYEINGTLFCGEFTLYPLNGFGQFRPVEWNYILGDKISLPILGN